MLSSFKPMTLTQFVLELAGKPGDQVEAEEREALRKLFFWGASPDNVRTYMARHNLQTYVETVKYVNHIVG